MWPEGLKYDEAFQMYYTSPKFGEFSTVYKEKPNMAQLKKGKFIVGTVTKRDEVVSVSANPHQHDTLISAQTEAERLAKVLTDKRTVVLEVRGVCTAASVEWN